MRPRSRLPSKRRLLLPTIREGTEETVRDLNEANSLHITGNNQAVSSEDYLLSICHLAHPTFPSRELDVIHHRLRPSRLSASTPSTFGLDLREEAHVEDMQQEDSKQLNGKLLFGCYGQSDPLEHLYGHPSNLSGGIRGAFVEGRFTRSSGRVWEGQARSRAHSIPRASSPDRPCQRKSSCPELHTSINMPIPNMSPKHCLSGTRKGSMADGGGEEERQNTPSKHSLISQWISDCRSAWREARARACMLPAIAEI
ncbi:uncharacterized protein LOC115427022 isoform X2 [Sphaeramia orbicularis]|uniref:uncharacterized protein LOC115427022 isoform X2 n=1 Tax=Sphaeramia orbicularis TaxID=375764 RepID=UPI00117DB3DB|nr:uncharacterized protein LOC115427022 isoform X2 [Sphaeramia orbicularis]